MGGICMIEQYKIKSFLSFVTFIILSFALAYLLVYQFSFLPFGYELKDSQDNRLEIQVNNLIGLEKDIITYSPPSTEKWRLHELKHQIKRQHGFYMILFAAMFISLYKFKLKKEEGMKKRAAFIQSGLIMGMIGTIIPLILLFNRIEELLGGAF